ncbi:hypothetical protein ACH5RR_022980 [Cinchona calisaya]|uniref:Reverse transcriptase zinc-binding domain-containing protein n=1 Tax=Cinchona calisaya TaxID=153742 RepID=A0ABD2ZEA9_9GENT
MWKLLNERLPTDDVLCIMGFYLPSKCGFCNNLESLHHTLLKCEFSKAIWRFFEGLFDVHYAGDSYLQHYLSSWSINSGSTLLGVMHKLIIPPTMCWNLWKSRNKLKYEDIISTRQQVIAHVVADLKPCFPSFPREFS